MMKFNNFSEILTYNAKEYPDKIFIHEYSTKKTVKYRELDSLVNRCCDFLIQKYQINEQEPISLCFENSIGFLILYLACIRLNAIVNPMPSSLSYQEIKKNVSFVKSKILFLSSYIKGEDFGFVQHVYFMEDGQDNFFKELSGFSERFEPGNISRNKNSVASYYYTSGTTSNPKCIMYTHRNMVCVIDSVVRTFLFNHEDRHLGILPLGHTAIINYSFLPMLYIGGTLVLCENFIKIRPDFWKIISMFEITYVEVVPTILITLLHTPYDSKDIKENRSLKYIACGSAPLPVDIQKEFQTKYGIPVANLYGLSETGPSHFDYPFRKNWKPGTIGIPLDINECIILREDKSMADVKEVGEIAIKGDNVFTGYLRNERAYQNVIYNGYFLTGDMGYKDDEGIFYFVDRKKDLIIKGGVNIFPGEIEEVIYELEGIRSVAVLGIPDPVFGEDVVAFVSLKERSAIGKEEILAHCSKNLQIFKCPKNIYIVENIPTGPSGKLLKRELREKYLK